MYLTLKKQKGRDSIFMFFFCSLNMLLLSKLSASPQFCPEHNLVHKDWYSKICMQAIDLKLHRLLTNGYSAIGAFQLKPLINFHTLFFCNSYNIKALYLRLHRRNILLRTRAVYKNCYSALHFLITDLLDLHICLGYCL